MLAVQRSPLSILIVDDDEVWLRTLRRGLGPPNEWDVAYASGGAEALEYLANKCFDVVVTDLSMPNVDGLAVLREVRVRYSRAIRILATASEAEIDDLDVDVLLAKPFLPKQLRRCIEAALAERQPAR